MINPVSTLSNKTEYINKRQVNNSVNPAFCEKRSISKYKPISLNEGTALFFNGIEKQLSELVHAVIDHPVKTLALLGGTSLALMSLPVIGIPTAVGGSVMALGFGAYALSKGVYHALEFVKNNKEGSYDTARMNLQQIGEDTVDIGLSVPFAPKAVKSVTRFAKYGKIGYNAALVSDLKAAKITEKWSVLNNAGKELSRSINYQSAVDKELIKLQGITDAEKAAIKQELLDFNVSQEKLADVVMDKWAKIKGIKTKPDLKYASLQESTGGYATTNDCSITINDHKKHISGGSFDNYQVVNTKLVNGKYEFTYRLKDSGQIVYDSIDKNIYDRYFDLCKSYKEMSPQAKQILVSVHEREHIHQYARISAHKGPDWINNITPRGKDLYAKMAQEIAPVQAGSVEAQEIEALAIAKNNGTPVSYIQNLREVGARDAEWAAMANPGFKRLDKVFLEANKIGLPKNSSNVVLLNGVRIESARA